MSRGKFLRILKGFWSRCGQIRLEGRPRSRLRKAKLSVYSKRPSKVISESKESNDGARLHNNHISSIRL